MRTLVAPLLLLVVLARSARAQETAPPEIRSGRERRVALPQGHDGATFRFRPSDLTGTFHVLAVSDVDIDLFVHSTRPDSGDLGDARHAGDSLHSSESITVRLHEDVEAATSATWFLRAVHPHSAHRATDVSLLVCDETREQRLLLAARRMRVVVAAGEEKAVRTFIPVGDPTGVLAGIETEEGRDRRLTTDAGLGEGKSGGGYFTERFTLMGIHNMSVGKKGDTLCYGRPISLLPESWRRRIVADGGRFVGEGR